MNEASSSLSTARRTSVVFERAKVGGCALPMFMKTVKGLKVRSAPERSARGAEVHDSTVSSRCGRQVPVGESSFEVRIGLIIHLRSCTVIHIQERQRRRNHARLGYQPPSSMAKATASLENSSICEKLNSSETSMRLRGAISIGGKMQR